MKVVVPDASVLLKWVLPAADEKDHHQALQIREAAIRGELILSVPSLWFYELGNTLSRRFPKQSRDLLESFRLFGLEEAHWSALWLDHCLLLVKRYQVTFYDAAYHGLALAENGVFVTADKQYVLKTRQAGAVMALEEWT